MIGEIREAGHEPAGYVDRGVLEMLSRALGTLLLGGTATTIVAAAAQVVVTVGTGDEFRLRDLYLGSIARRLLERFDVHFLAWMPALVHEPLPLPAALAAAILTAVVIASGAALLLALVAAPFLRGRSKEEPAGLSALIVAAFAFPAFLHVSPKVLASTGIGGIGAALGTAAAVAVVLAILLAFVLKSPARHSRLRKIARRGSAITIGLAALIAMVGLGWRTIAGEAARPIPPAGTPNILVVSIDSLRADHLGCYGYARDTTPNIDRLAAQGVLFGFTFAPTTWTLPSHLTLLTSLPPEEHGVIDDGMKMSDEAVTLAEVLRQAGFTTAGFVSAPYLQAQYGFAQGFDVYDDYSVASASKEAALRAVTSPRLVQLVTDWLRQWHRDGRKRPFFVFVHMW
ncbi:MAG: sulfatase, partial [Candidatus Binatia bacterium]